jgi:hypothetical protein
MPPTILWRGQKDGALLADLKRSIRRWLELYNKVYLVQILLKVGINDIFSIILQSFVIYNIHVHVLWVPPMTLPLIIVYKYSQRTCTYPKN